MIGSMTPYNLGGTGVYLDNLSRELVRQGVEVCVITWGDERKDYRDAGRDIHVIKYGRFRTLRSVLLARKLRKEYDILHVNHVVTANIARQFVKAPMVLTVHGYYAYERSAKSDGGFSSEKLKKARKKELKAMRSSDSIITVGNTIRKYIIHDFGIEPEKVFYVPNGVDAERFRKRPVDRGTLSNELGIDRILLERDIVLYAKALTRMNGIETFVDAAEHLITERKSNDGRPVFLIAGDGPLREEMAERVKEKGMEKSVFFLGRIPQNLLLDIMSISSVFAGPFIPPRKETIFGVGDTLGISHLEAMSCGLPVVATKTGVKRSSFEFEMDGSLLVTAPADAVGLGNAISFLLRNPEKADDIGKKARRTIMENYTWEKNVERTLDAYAYAERA